MKSIAVALLVFYSAADILASNSKNDKVEYIRLPLLMLEEGPSTSENFETTSETTVLSVLPDKTAISSSADSVNRGEGIGNKTGLPGLRSVGASVRNVIDQLTNLVVGDDDGDDDYGSGSMEGKEEKEAAHKEGEVKDEAPPDADDDDGNEDEEEQEDSFGELDLIELVQELERQADEEEQTGIFPEILDILHGKLEKDKNGSFTTSTTTTTTVASLTEDNSTPRSGDTLKITLDENGELQLGSEDFSEFSEEIVDGISAGVEESLRMSDDLEIDDFNFTSGGNGTAETRQFSVYLFQGQYYAEPRLNRFIDGAIRNMGTELRVASMDPLYFRVLPRGNVAEREQPLMAASGVRRRRPGGGGNRVTGRQLKLPAFFRPSNANNQNKENQKLRQQLLKPSRKRQKVVNGQQQVTRVTNLGGSNLILRRKRQQQRQRRRRQRIRQQRLKQQKLKRRKKQQQIQQQLRNKRKKQQQILLQRIRRRIKQDVGGGRIEGLSRVQRDGDAEMQLFGNYTLIRSHMKMGPVELTMQFRTKNGIRRSGATLPVVRAHTVTRVNHEGSEMIDYLLDRPTPEMIRVRGSMFPQAQRIARNIFSRLFLPNSFLVAKLREKAALSYLSRPVARRKR